MKIGISYFYQIRNFEKNMVPMSTALSDPTWYHDNQSKDYIFYDKRGILNGLRLKPIIVQGGWNCGCPCEEKNPQICDFIKNYREALNKIDFDKMYKGIEKFAEQYKKENNIEEEIIMTLIVYETPTNPCSERGPLIDYFKSKGIEVKEFIPQLKVQQGTFEF